MNKQNYETAAESAKRLGVTTRAIQKWASSGKIKSAEKIGRTWFIPKNYGIPEEEKIIRISDFRPSMPLLNSSFELGRCLEYVLSIPDEDDRNIAMAEYLFYTGKGAEAVELLERYIDSPDISLRYSASVLTVFAGVSSGNVKNIERAASVLADIIKASYENEASPEIFAMGVMTSVGSSVLWHAPVPEYLPELSGFIKHLPAGYKLWCCYILALKAYLEKDYVKSLTIADMALAFSEKSYPLAEIYIHLISVIALMNLRRPEEAEKRFEQVWELTHRDGFIGPIASHHGMMLGIIEVYYKRNHPGDFKKLMAITGVYGKQWRKIHNIRTASEVTDNLTPTEFTVAMLYNRGWSAQEIASFLDISESTTRNYIKTIYVKLGISDKKSLAKYMMK